MLEGLRSYLENRTALGLAKDAIDVFLVYYVVYRVLLVVRGTRAIQVGLGLGVVFLLYVTAQQLELVTVLSITGALIQSILLVIVVVFANDIRRGLQRVGSRAWFGRWARAQETKVIDEVVDAATELARHRIGALITFEQEANLDEFVGSNKGIQIDSQVTTELLVSLFVPESVNKLHDGSVIIRNYRIAKAAVFFPMPEGRVMDPSFGSRHRAALGITEETDAVVVIVSEERGTISFCFNGNIAPNLDGPKLKTMLEAIFSPKTRKKNKKSQRRSEAPLSSDARSTRRDSEITPRPSGREAPAPASNREPPLRESVVSRDPEERRAEVDRRVSRPDRDTRPLRPRPSTDRISHTPTLLTFDKSAMLTPAPMPGAAILTPAQGREPLLPAVPDAEPTLLDAQTVLQKDATKESRSEENAQSSDKEQDGRDS